MIFPWFISVSYSFILLSHLWIPVIILLSDIHIYSIIILLKILILFCMHACMQWHPTPVLLPGKSHGWRRLVGCSPWRRKESDTTERLRIHFSLSCVGEGNGNPLQYFCLENPREWAAISGVPQSQTQLKRLSSSSSSIHAQSVQLCPSLRDPMDYSPAGSSVHGILQARILGWVAISSSRGSSPPRNQIHISCIGRWTLPLSHLGCPFVTLRV